VKFLALGDSYTIGEGVEPSECWPIQLATSLRGLGVEIQKPDIIAVTGWTTDELIVGIRKAKLKPEYALVSLLIGVNNQYRGYSLETYHKEFFNLLKMSVNFAGGEQDRVIVLSIPDWSVTPFAVNREKEIIATQIEEFNRVNSEVATKFRTHYIDITPISRRAGDAPQLITTDGLHPSGLMYSQWVTKILPLALEILTMRK
jgi:lysophospholipase L1-like esterase